MSLKNWLAAAQFDADREPAGADVIPLKPFDVTRCADDIKRLDVQARLLIKRLADERARYEETIGVMENELEQITTELAAKRAEVREWAEHLGALRDAGTAGSE